MRFAILISAALLCNTIYPIGIWFVAAVLLGMDLYELFIKK
jgi:hypothetical protein